MLAVARNDKKYVTGKLNSGFKINSRDMVGQTACHWAAYRGNLEILEVLASKNAKLDITDFDGRTPLHWAIRKVRLRCLKFLLQATENQPKVIDLQTRGMNETCLHKACREGSVDGVRLLLNYGANIDIRNNENLTAYEIAQDLYNLECAEASSTSENEEVQDVDKDEDQAEVDEKASNENNDQKVAEYVKEDEKDSSQGVMKPKIESNFKSIMDLLQARPKRGDPSLKTEFDEGTLSSKRALKRRMSYKQSGGQMSELNEERLRGGVGKQKSKCVIC